MIKIGEIVNLNAPIPRSDNLETVSVFIDAEYVIQSMKTLKGKPKNHRIGINDIEWKEIINYLSEGRNKKEIIYYSSELDRNENPDTHKKQQTYLQSIRQQIPDITLRMGKMQKVKVKTEKTWKENARSGETFLYTWIQKGIDVKMAVDLIVKAVKNDYETAIILTGDSDFEEVIKEITNLEKRVELVTFDRFDSGIIATFSRTATRHRILTYEIGKEQGFYKIR